MLCSIKRLQLAHLLVRDEVLEIRNMVFRFDIVSIIGELLLFNTEMIPFMLFLPKCRSK